MDARLPGACGVSSAALHTPTDGRAEPHRRRPRSPRRRARTGAAILTECAVRGIETQAGRVSGVVTEKGRIACDAVVLAGGAWSRLFCGNAGIDLPQLNVLGSVFRTAPLGGGAGDHRRRLGLRVQQAVGRRLYDRPAQRQCRPTSRRTRSVCCSNILPTLRQQLGEFRLRIGRRFLEEWGTRRTLVAGRGHPVRGGARARSGAEAGHSGGGTRALSRTFPAFAQMQVAESWGGMIDVTPDAVPVIGEVAHIPGFFLATGFSGHGFGIGPGAGRLVADLVAGDTPMVDPAPFRFSRFTEGRRQAA